MQTGDGMAVPRRCFGKVHGSLVHLISSKASPLLPCTSPALIARTPAEGIPQWV